MAYDTYKYLPRRTASDKVLRDKAFAVAINLQCNGYQQGIDSMVYNLFYKKKFLTQERDLFLRINN